MQFATLAIRGAGATRQLIRTRCDRGARIARELGFPEATAEAIHQLDEHWNGCGYPDGLRGEEISLLARILSIAQSVEAFAREFGPAAACAMAVERRGRWFEPQLVEVLLASRNDTSFWQRVLNDDPWSVVARCEPSDDVRRASEEDLDRIALAFAHVVDAKSPWTFRHSVGVAEIAVGIAETLGYDADGLRRIRRTALLHDLGKLGVSNLILDKPGKLDEQEFATLRRHPEFSEQILSRISCFVPLAPLAGAHHERLDGRGYYRGIAAGELPLEARLLTVADIFEAMTAARPYRDAVPQERVLEVLERDAGAAICPTAFAGLQSWLARRNFDGRVEQQLLALEQLQGQLAACNEDHCSI
jgi:HD-GYP domain-containing protein (c-di-GMP phosphodiesterase class II)